METSQEKDTAEQKPSQATANPPKGTWLGQPKGLFALAGTEISERFSFYGMKAILGYFLLANLAEGGLGFKEGHKDMLVALYGTLCYLLCIPSGWLTDRWISPRKAVMGGAILQCSGHLLLGLPGNISFVSGLWLLILGTGLLKTNISSMVGKLYGTGDKRIDRGFSIFYQGINIGAGLGSFAIPLIKAWYGYHIGFASAGVCMLFSLATFVWGFRYYGKEPHAEKYDKKPYAWLAIPIMAIGGIALIYLLRNLNLLSNEVRVGHIKNILIGLVGTLLLACLLFFYRRSQNQVERDRVLGLGLLALGVVLFNCVFEQAAGLFSSVAKHHTDNNIFGLFTILPAHYQVLNPIFILLFALPVTHFWERMQRRFPNLSIMTKVGVGLLLTALSCGVVVLAARAIDAGKISFLWLVVVYFLHTLAELCIFTTVLPFITKIAPANMKSSYMGFVWVVISFGGALSGHLGKMAGCSEKHLASSFTKVGVGLALLGILFVLAANRISKLFHGAEKSIEEDKATPKENA